MTKAEAFVSEFIDMQKKAGRNVDSFTIVCMQNAYNQAVIDTKQEQARNVIRRAEFDLRGMKWAHCQTSWA